MAKGEAGTSPKLPRGVGGGGGGEGGENQSCQFEREGLSHLFLLNWMAKSERGASALLENVMSA